MTKLKNFFNQYPYLAAFIIFFIINLIVFHKFWFQQLIPYPGDGMIGVYYPWLNQKWGTITGVPVKNPLMSDVFSLLYPWRLQAIQYWQSGHVPTWDWHSFMGMSLIGNFQAASFNPFNLLFLLPLSFNQIWGLQVVIQPLIAMLTMFILLKSWKLRLPASYLGALIYGLSGPLIIWMEYNVHGFAIATYPLIIWATWQYAFHQSVKAALWIPLILGLVFIWGYPQMFIYFGLTIGIIWLISLFTKPVKQTLVTTTILFLSAIWAFLLAAVQILPGWQALQLSVRSLDSVAQQQDVIFMPFKHLVAGLIPDYFGNPATYNYWGDGSYESFTLYTSLVGLAFVLLAFTNAKYRLQLILLSALSLAIFLISLDTPLSQLLQTMSMLGLKGSIGARGLYLYSAGIAGLAAIGFHTLLDRPNFKTLFLSLSLPGLIIILITAISYLQSDTFGINSAQQSILIRNSAWPVLIAGFVGLSMLAWYWKFKSQVVVITVILLCLVILDMSRFTNKYLPFVPQSWIYPDTSTTDFLFQNTQTQSTRLIAEPGELLPSNTWAPYQLNNIGGYNILLPTSSADYISVINTGQTGTNYSRFPQVENLDSPLLSLAGGQYLLALQRDQGVPTPDSSLSGRVQESQQFATTVFTSGPVAILENPQAKPLFYIPDSYFPLASRDQALLLLDQGEFDYQTTVTTDRSLGTDSLGQCQINRTDLSMAQIILDVTCDTQSLLATTITNFPGWQATIDSQPADLLLANGQFLGLPLPAGQSTVQFRFWPSTLTIGSQLTSISLLAWLALAAYLYRPMSKQQ